MKNNSESLFIYPDYIVQVLNQLMTSSADNKNSILSKSTDLINILYNQYNDFPITEQVYNMVWNWIIRMLDAGHYNWVKQYWNTANQYYTFKLEYSTKEQEKKKFLEFHIMLCTLFFYKKHYGILQHAFNFTNSLPAKYPLIPSTFSNIFNIYEELSEKNKHMYLLRYHMLGIFEGAGEENKIEGLLVNYLALLMIRLYDVNDYNITYSNPLAHPVCGNVSEENIYKIELANILIDRVNKITQEQINSCGLTTSIKGKQVAMRILNEYISECSQHNKQIEQNPKISEEKQKLIRTSLIESTKKYKPKLPKSSTQTEEKNDIKFTALQCIKLEKRLILDGYLSASSNLGDSLINALNSQIQQFYCYQFRLRTAVKTYTISYCDFSKAMLRLFLTSEYTILAMGISNIFFDEIKGFTRNDKNIFYYQSPVYEIPNNNEAAILIMKNQDVPRYKFINLPNDKISTEIEQNQHLFSNIDNLTPQNLILHVKQGFSIHMPSALRYIRLKVAYNLESDNMLINKIEPIKNYI